jgi:hypothetical protein
MAWVIDQRGERVVLLDEVLHREKPIRVRAQPVLHARGSLPIALDLVVSQRILEDENSTLSKFAPRRVGETLRRWSHAGRCGARLDGRGHGLRSTESILRS